MATSHPSFRKPPLIETALAVQFKPLKALRNAHLGMFWSELKKEYPITEDAESIMPQFERFGDERSVESSRLPRLRLASSHGARMRMLSSDESQMVQLQNGMLVFNWRRVNDSTSYPRFTTTKPALDAVIERFAHFLGNHQLGAFVPTQWEVTYVNHMARGTVWNSPADWHLVFPGLLGPATTAAGLVLSPLETMSGEWHFEIGPQRGRLHVNLHHGWVGPASHRPKSWSSFLQPVAQLPKKVEWDWTLG